MQRNHDHTQRTINGPGIMIAAMLLWPLVLLIAALCIGAHKLHAQQPTAPQMRPCYAFLDETCYVTTRPLPGYLRPLDSAFVAAIAANAAQADQQPAPKPTRPKRCAAKAKKGTGR